MNRMFCIPTSLKFGIAGQTLGNCKSHLWPYEKWDLFYIKVCEARYFATTDSHMEYRVIVVCKVCFIIGHYTRKLLGAII